MSQYDLDPLTALQAKEQAQKLAFAPVAFQAARSLQTLGILAILDAAGSEGLGAEQIAERSGVSEYGVKVLLDMGLSALIVTFKEGRYRLARVGHFLLHDAMTRINMDFTADVCYRAMSHLTTAIRTGRPEGLQELGHWPTIYEGLAQLPEPARTSWFDFDHYYSDQAFPELLERVFASKPQHIVDIGGNTGRWALQCCAHDPKVEVTLVDLPRQLALAMENAREQGFAGRIHGYPLNILEEGALPERADVWWMSQFLDCFSPMEILRILRRVRAAMQPGASVYILELFWDRQQFEAAAYSLNATSLYFTCLANGNSRFYRSDDFLAIVDEAGFVIVEQVDDIGLGHTLLRLGAG